MKILIDKLYTEEISVVLDFHWGKVGRKSFFFKKKNSLKGYKCKED